LDVDYLILADAAQVADGKLYLLGGGWDRLSVNGLPAIQFMGVAIAILVPWSETNTTQTLTVSIEDEDGGAVMQPVAVRVEVGRPSGLSAGADQRVLMALNAQLALPRLGDYAVTATLDSGARKRHRFSVQAGPMFRETAAP